MNKKIILVSLAVLLAGSVYAFAGTVKAEDAAGTFPPLIQKLVDKFNLDTAQVQVVLDEFRGERQKDFQARLEERLNDLVESGDLTEPQKKLILEKHQQLQQSGEHSREEMQTWAEENGIDLKYLGGGRMGGMHGGMGMGPGGW